MRLVIVINLHYHISISIWRKPKWMQFVQSWIKKFLKARLGPWTRRIETVNICNLPELLSQIRLGLHNIMWNISLNTSLKTVFPSRINSTICFYFCNLIWHGYPTASNKRIQSTSWSMREIQLRMFGYRLSNVSSSFIDSCATNRQIQISQPNGGNTAKTSK